MIFNSIPFIIFFLLAFIIHWFLFKRNFKSQNFILFALSLFFYSYWDYRFLSLILFSIIINYYSAILITHQNTKKKKRYILYINIFLNLGVLFTFKYFNFFINSLKNFLNLWGSDYLDSSLISFILPVGISFFTFQGLSYTIDVYKGRLNYTNDFILFGAYISFFPQLVAGPIERASDMIPQFNKKRKFSFEEAKLGLSLTIWGFFKKIVIADQLALFVNPVFENFHFYSSIELIIAVFFFSIQIYCDFSGYSDIAIGISRFFGIKLKSNFKFPYFSTNISDFWRRWHISLSTWFRDYLYFPLGGSKINKLITTRNVFIIFMTSGLWHGANWTFIVWGFIHAILFIIAVFFKPKLKKNIKYQNLKCIVDFFKIIFTFLAVSFAWIFFRSNNLSDAIELIKLIFKNFSFTTYSFNSSITYSLILIFVFLFFEILFRKNETDIFSGFNKVKKRLILFVLIILVANKFLSSGGNFIYFQF